MHQRTEQEIMQNWKGDSGTPLVSVCTITYNHENYINEAIDSFLMQETDFPFEVLISDDCSPDGTADVIRQYMEKFPNIINANLRDKNVGAAINGTENLQRAKGEYIALCEGDDYWTDPLKLQKQVSFLEGHEEYVITYSDIQAFDSNGNLQKNYGGATRDVEAIELQKCISISTMTTCFRNVLKEFPPEDQCSRLGDLFLWSLLGQYGKGKFLEDIKPTKYRVHEGGAFSKQTKQTKQEMWLITSGSLYAYYNRIGNKMLADYFLERNIKASISVFGLFPLLKMFLKKISKIKS